jgi:type VI protein secretion system component Hcp
MNDAYLMITDFEGETESKDFDKHFEVVQWSTSVSMPQTGSRSMKNRGAGGKAEIPPLSFVIRADKNLPKLMEMCASGLVKTEAILKLVAATGQESAETLGEKNVYLSIHMHQVDMANISVSGGGGSEVFVSFSLAFDAIEWLWDGDAGKTAACWNLVTNVAKLG